MVLAGVDHAPLDPGEALAQRAELAELRPDLPADVGQALLDAVEALAELVGVERVARGVPRDVRHPPLDVLQPNAGLLETRQRHRRALGRTVGHRLERQDELAEALLRHVRQPVLERAHALAEPLRIAPEGHGEAAQEVVDARHELLLDAAHEPSNLSLEPATDVDDATLHPVAKRLGLVDQHLATARQQVLERRQPPAPLILRTRHPVASFATPSARARSRHLCIDAAVSRRRRARSPLR